MRLQKLRKPYQVLIQLVVRCLDSLKYNSAGWVVCSRALHWLGPAQHGACDLEGARQCATPSPGQVPTREPSVPAVIPAAWHHGCSAGEFRCCRHCSLKSLSTLWLFAPN